MAYTSKNPRKQLPGTYINVPVIHEDSNDVAIFESLADIAEECVRQGISFNYRLYRALPVLVKNVHAFVPDSSVLEGQPNRFNPNPLPLSSRLQAEMHWVTYLLFDELQRVAPSGCFFGPSPEGVIGFWQKKSRRKQDSIFFSSSAPLLPCCSAPSALFPFLCAIRPAT